MKQARPNRATCPCESGKPYEICCKPLHDGYAYATSAEALMRSRYSAYALKREGYVLATWHVNTRPATLNLQQDTTKWLGLAVKRAETTDDTAIVEFVARYRAGGGRAEKMHEISRFVFIDGRWVYLDGERIQP